MRRVFDAAQRKADRRVARAEKEIRRYRWTEAAFVDPDFDDFGEFNCGSERNVRTAAN